jgi:hypothetical protein
MFMRRLAVSVAVFCALASPVFAQTDTALCDRDKGYIEVYKQFVEGWADAVNSGKLVDPKKTEIAVWATAWENRMLAGESLHALCVDMIGMRWAEGF